MITINDSQYAALAQHGERGFFERMVDGLMARGHSRAEAEAAAAQAWQQGRPRGLVSEDEVEAFAETLAACHGHEPAWSVEIIDGAAPHKAERLRRCLAVATGARH